MSVLQTIDEGSTAYLLVDFKDKNNNPVMPNTILFDIECLTTVTNIRSSVAIAPATQIEIVLLPTDNAIIDETNYFELRRVSVRANYGISESLNDEYEYWVRNMSKV